MGFAEEVKSQSRSSTPPPTAVAAAAATNEAAPAAKELPSAIVESAQVPANPFDSNLPSGSAPVDPAAKNEVVPTETKAAADTEKPAAKIKIAGKEFDSLELAVKYAEELEIANIQDKAFIEGVQAAKGKEDKPTPAAPPSFIQEAKELIFEDPEKAIQKIVEGTEKRIFDAYNKMTEQQNETQARVVRDTKIWGDFYTSNDDLSEAKDFVRFTFEQNKAELGTMPIAAGLEKLAELTRKGLKIQKQEALPKEELRSKAMNMPGASNGATTTEAPVTKSEPKDFVSQINTLRKRK